MSIYTQATMKEQRDHFYTLGLRIFLFTTASGPALGPIHLLSNGYQGLFPWGNTAGA